MLRLCPHCMEKYDDALDLCPVCHEPPDTPAKEASHLAPGTLLNKRYDIGLATAYDGYSVTYIAHDRNLDMTVSVKEYFPGEFCTRVPGKSELTVFPGDKAEQFASGLSKFREEASKLMVFKDDPEIISVIDTFPLNGTAYMVTEYLEGRTLQDYLLEKGRLSVDEALPILHEILHGLKKIHSVEGLIHRDICPQNIFLTRTGKVKITNFAASRFASTTHSRSLTVLIKPGYAPEEQYRTRGDQGPHTDVYAAAATFYTMITGTPPPVSLERAANDTLKKPSRLGVKIPRNVETALLNALNVRIKFRTKTAEEFETSLLSSHVKVVIDDEKPRKWPVWLLPLSALLGAGILLFAILVAAGVIDMSAISPNGSSLGANETLVPNVINKETSEAQEITEQADLLFLIGGKAYDNTIPQNYVLSQDLQGGSHVASGSTLSVKISAGVRQVTVPDVIGMKEEEAVKLLEDTDFITSTTAREYRSAPGSVAEQSLEPGSKAESGTGISLVISKGIPGGDSSISSTLENLVGKNYDDAVEDIIKDYIYLIVKDREYSEDYDAGIIIAQDVPPGTSISQNTNVGVVVSRGPELITVPDVQYESQENAKAILSELGLNAVELTEYNSNVARGLVTRQDPAYDTQVRKGTAVTIWISLGPAPVKETQPSSTPKSETPYTPPQTEPSPTEPPQTEPPQTEPPQTEPPQTEPPQTEPPQPSSNTSGSGGGNPIFQHIDNLENNN